MLQDLLTKTRELAGKKTAAAEDAYRRLVRRLAGGGEEVAPEQVVRDLEKWGKDVGQFQADVERTARRLELRAKFDQLPDLERKRAAIAAAVREAEARYTAAIAAAGAAHGAAMGELSGPEREVAAAIAAGEAARRELEETCDRPEVLARFAAADAREKEARNRLYTLEANQRLLIGQQLPRALDELAAYDRKGVGSMVPRESISFLERESRTEAAALVDRLREAVPRLEQEIAAAREAHAAALAERDAAAAEKLVP
jgi:hypothetical protein